jgi:hypothetical protein
VGLWRPVLGTGAGRRRTAASRFARGLPRAAVDRAGVKPWRMRPANFPPWKALTHRVDAGPQRGWFRLRHKRRKGRKTHGALDTLATCWPSSSRRPMPRIERRSRRYRARSGRHRRECRSGVSLARVRLQPMTAESRHVAADGSQTVPGTARSSFLVQQVRPRQHQPSPSANVQHVVWTGARSPRGSDFAGGQHGGLNPT